MQRTVLLVTMALDIGGAETHLFELANSLKEKGMRVQVASAGGVFAEQLQSAGIPHYTLPLNRKMPWHLLKSFFGLRRIVRTQGVDLIHAHARIPAFVSHFVCKVCHIPLCTTVHGTYAVSPLLVAMTRWGDRILAVSEDIKYYLIKEYHIPEDRIELTVNGIDLERFAPAPKNEPLAHALGLDKNQRTLCYIGRLDRDSGEPAFTLVSRFAELKEALNDCQLLIVGGGERYDELRQLRSTLPAALRSDIHLCGPRTDVERILPLCDGVVALSRAALEAMSAEIPVVLAGNYGFLGLNEPKIEAACRATNFTARGYNGTADDLILSCIELMTLPPERSRQLKQSGRALVQREYSTDRMAADAISLYAKLPYQRFDGLLLGYYGFENSGDDALLCSIVQNLRQREPDVRLCVLSNRPKSCSAEFSLKAVHRFDPFGIRWAFSRSRVLILGGGNLLQDATSLKSLLYYVFMLRSAQRKGMKTMLYANGIGPIRSRFGLQRALNTLRYCDRITLREESSQRFLLNQGIPASRMELTADETLTLSPCSEARRIEILRSIGMRQNLPYLCVSLRPYSSMPEKLVQRVAQAVETLCEAEGCAALLIPMQHPKDVTITVQLAGLLNCDHYLLPAHYSAQELIGLMSGANLVIGMRLHALVYALCAATPIVGLSYDPKVDAFLQAAGLGHGLAPTFLTADVLLEHAYHAICSKQRQAITAARNRMRGLALRNSEIALSLMASSQGKPDELHS